MKLHATHRRIHLVMTAALLVSGTGAAGCNLILGVRDDYKVGEDAGVGGCDGEEKTFHQDSDSDGFGSPSITITSCSAEPGYVTDATDCNDLNPTIYPGAPEVCDILDNNCDATIDNGDECCVDGARRGDETDKDCGGLVCAPCPDGKACLIGQDCVSGVCAGSVCQAPRCDDSVRNGAETGTDCGGTSCPACADGEPCIEGTDCINHVCSGGLCEAPTCGNGIAQTGEACDDANTTSNDGCSDACAIELGYACGGEPSECTSSCGDGLKAAVEPCDDGNLISGDGCGEVCAVELGYICLGTQPSTCVTTCGDGIKASIEGCDDQNTLNGDGCSSSCALEIGFACTGDVPNNCQSECGDGYVRADEECDDGGTAGLDGCSSSCNWEVLSELEPNNDKAAADARATGATPVLIADDRVIAASAMPGSDVDVFKMTVPAGGAVVRFETFDSSGTDCVGVATTLKVYTSAFIQYSSVISGTGDGIGDCSALVLAMVGGTYYVSVEETGKDAVIESYQLQVNYQSVGSTESEPNDTLATANSLPTTAPPDSDVVMSSAHSSGDMSSDWYAINIPEGKSVRAEIIEGDVSETCESNGIDSRLFLLAPADILLAQDNDSGRGKCSLIDGTGATPLTVGAKNLAAGLYYLRVDSAASGAAAQFNYRLAVTIR